MTKAIIPALLLIPAFLSCQRAGEEESRELLLTNTASFALKDKAVSIQRTAIPDLPEEGAYPLIRTLEGDTIPSQLDDLDGDGKWDELFFVADLPAGAAQSLTLQWVGSKPEYTPRTSVRFGKRSGADEPVQPAVSDTLYAGGLPKSIGYQPYQTDGPSWENDKIGFRHYLDGRNIKDIFGKKVAYMSPENVGLTAEGAVEDNYHVMRDWGRDILAAGNSVGLGGIAMMAGDSLARLGVTVDDSVNNVESTVFRILSEGPVRSVIDFSYHNWQVRERGYNVRETVSIWPGMYAYRNSVSVSGLQGDEQLLVGLVNSNTDHPVKEIRTFDNWVVLLTHDRQTYEKEWWLGMALILPKDVYEGYLEAPQSGKLSNTFLAKLKIKNGQPVNYYAAAGWEISDEGFRDAAYFEQYIGQLVGQLNAEVNVELYLNN